jgi:hypothetical protein
MNIPPLFGLLCKIIVNQNLGMNMRTHPIYASPRREQAFDFQLRIQWKSNMSWLWAISLRQIAKAFRKSELVVFMELRSSPGSADHSEVQPIPTPDPHMRIRLPGSTYAAKRM